MSNKYITSSSVNHDGPDDDSGPTTYTVYVNAKGLPSHSSAHEFIGAVERLLLSGANPKSDEWTTADTSALMADYEARIEAITADKERAQKIASNLQSEKEHLDNEITKLVAEKDSLLRELSSLKITASNYEGTIGTLRQKMSDMVGQHQLALAELRQQQGVSEVEDLPDTRDLRIEELQRELAAAKSDAEASRMALDKVRNAKHLETVKPPPKPAVIETQEPAEVDMGEPLPKPSKEFDGFLTTFGESVSRRNDLDAIAKLWVENDTIVQTLDKPALNRAKRIVVERLLTIHDTWTEAEARLAFGRALAKIATGKDTHAEPERNDLTPASPVEHPAAPPPAPEPVAAPEASNSPLVTPEFLARMQSATRVSEIIKMAFDEPGIGRDVERVITAILSVKDQVKMLNTHGIADRLRRSVPVQLAADNVG